MIMIGIFLLRFADFGAVEQRHGPSPKLSHLLLHLFVSDGEAMSVPSITLTTCFH
jgi:hypothetical protein